MTMKRVYRNTRGAVVGGVCLGIADYFGVDPTIVRLAWALTIFLGGTGVLAYLIAWLIIPPKPAGEWNGSPQMTGEMAPDPEQLDQVTGSGDQAGVEEAEFESGATPRPSTASDRSGANTLGLILITLGGFWLARNLVPHWGWHRYWPFALVAVGLYMVITAFRSDGR